MTDIYEAPRLEPMFSASNGDGNISTQGIPYFVFMLVFVVGLLYVALATSTMVTNDPAE